MSSRLSVPARRRTFLATLLVCGCAFAAGAADAHARTLILTSSGAYSKPSTLSYGGADWGLPGVRYFASNLSWRNWGGGIARTAGRFRVCPNMGTCERFSVRIATSGFSPRAEGTPDNLYSYVSFTRVGRSRPFLKLCVYAEACRLGPIHR